MPTKKSSPASPSGPADGPSDTRTRLLQAAMAEFIEAGYAGTDTNRIARRAGFAPQTFYRWFADKTAILIAVLHVWDEVEHAVLSSLFDEQDASTLQLAEACVENIRPFLTFRRNLREVASRLPEIRAERAAGRQRLLAWLAGQRPQADSAQLASWLVQFEQLCEAIAEGQFIDLGTSENAAMADLARVIDALRR